MTLFIALNQIREEQAPSLSFDFVCRAGVCGSCGMIINGRPGLACRTLTDTLPGEVTLLPLPTFELIADLSVNTGKWMGAMNRRLENWVHLNREPDLDCLEAPMEPEQAETIYEMDAASSAAAVLPPVALRSCGTVLSVPSVSTR